MKNVVFDTNVLLMNPNIITRFKNNVIVPYTILNELDHLKKDPAHKINATLAINNIERDGIKIIKTRASNLKMSNDNLIIHEALSMYAPEELVLVSNDTGMRLNATSNKIETKKLAQYLNEFEKKTITRTSKKEDLYELLLKKKFAECSKKLINNQELDFNYYLDNGFTPLIECIRNKKFIEVDFIINQSSTYLDLPDTAKLHMPAFLHASQHRQIETMKKLISAGANHHITIKGRNAGNSALLIAAYDNALNVITFLIENPELEVSINQADSNGFTALIKAAFRGHHKLAQYLVSKGADPLIRDKMDMSALDHAEKNNHKDIAVLLTKHIDAYKKK